MAVTPVNLFSDEWTTLNSIQSANSASSAERADKKTSGSQGTAFDTFLNAAVDIYKEADSLQYTVKVTNAVVSAYKELMNMQL